MSNVENLEDHMAFSCTCGCVRFNLLKSSGIECDDCGEKLKQIFWGIAEAEKQEPVAWWNVIPGGRITDKWESARIADYNQGWNDYRKAAKTALKNLYTSPPQRQPLTDEQLKPLIQKAMRYYGHNPDHWTVTAGAGFCILARAIEAAHGIKENNQKGETD